MKKTSIGIFLTFLLLFSGCSNAEPEITESEAEAIVEQRHTNSFGTVEIISISYERGRYVVEWENEGNCEWGVDYLDGQSGEIEMGERTIC
ncbi:MULTISPECIES: hypothetical protein [unclassified Planococcus (in: firmicutes)]|uniref:hypothetical protein n=1 Tax=unclassified Planococcus (in: firmicutes) TaxID=2662419 RepID=UPI0011B61520|nr:MULTISPECIES: hypothetical protein [unclassified Planococcus (in: firmicutes)]TWT05448.1 hypothetical protein FQV26_13525 [Planococcus sp. CPCC 101016]